jgi:hypothetical protein
MHGLSVAGDDRPARAGSPTAEHSIFSGRPG